MIAQSDYYLVILGGRYGSLSAEGISYTEMEYDYAVELGIPVMGFVPTAPDEIAVGKTDKDPEAAEKLAAFQAKVQTKMTKHWANAEDLGSKVTRGLIHLIKNNPRPGWVRGDQAMSPEVRTEIAELRAKLAELEKQEATTAAAPAQIDVSFAHGKETVDVNMLHRGRHQGRQMSEDETLTYTWDEIIEVLGPFMLDEAPEPSLRTTFNNHLLLDLRAQAEDDSHWGSGWSAESADITDRSWGAIVVQLRALGFITTGTKKRTVSDKDVYWRDHGRRSVGALARADVPQEHRPFCRLPRPAREEDCRRTTPVRCC